MGIPTKYLRFRVLGFTLILLLGLIFLYHVREILIPFLWALFFAYLLTRPVDYLEEKKVSRTWSIVFIYLLFGGIFSLVVFLIMPAVLQELALLADTIPTYIQLYQSWMQKIQQSYQGYVLPEAVRAAVNQAVLRIEESTVAAIGTYLEGIIRSTGSLVTVIIAPILAFYFLKDIEVMKRQFTSILPRGWRGDILTILAEVDEAFLGFIQGNLLVCVLIGVLTGAVLGILGVDFALLLGLIAGLAELVPYFGPVLGAIPAIAIAGLESPRLAIYVGVSLFVIQQIESSIIAPKIIGDRVGLHPLVVVFALLAGGKLWGFLGLLLAVPLAALVKILLNYLYLKCLED